ncbi:MULTISPECIES: hypothetical protein [unclassified Bradyrhizobium]|uniref:hypothetical protein n=1 Tax=unclassified Bradyrhizobium TaxID=2631580 RepID=UPI002917053D|nr:MULTISPECIES: hypothetical protein [unclassified Bradyrhizobium]
MDALRVEDTSMGLMKALHFITTQQQRRKIKPKFQYASAGSTTRATRCLTRFERSHVTELVQQLAPLDPKTQQDQIKEIMQQLSQLPVTFFPVKREMRIDYSKIYPYRSTKRGG